MSKTIRIVVIVSMILLTAAGCIEAFGQESAVSDSSDCKLSASITPASKPGQVAVTISLEQMQDNPGLNALAFDITYDKDAFELIDTDTTGSGWSGMEYSFSENFNVYPYRCGWISDQLEPDKISGKLIQLIFRVKEGAVHGKKYTFCIENTEGGYTFLVNGRPVSAKVDFSTVGCEYICSRWGDVDKNGKVDFADVLFLKRCTAGWHQYQNIDGTAADINTDGKIDITDLMILERHIAGWKGYEILPINMQ